MIYDVYTKKKRLPTVKEIEAYTKLAADTPTPSTPTPVPTTTPTSNVDTNMDIRRLSELTDKDVQRLRKYLQAYKSLTIGD